MSRKREPSAGGRARVDRDDYWSLSARPLHSLVFLTPLVLLYELGSLLYLTDPQAGVQQTIRAKKLLDVFFNNFGIAGLLVSGVAMLTVLLAWHILSRDRWQVRVIVILGMLMEACLWALPLVVFGAIFQRASVMIDPAAGVAARDGAVIGLPACLSGSTSSLFALGWQARATIAVGAGLYEELLFRMIGMAALHFVVKDVLQAKEFVARAVAIVGSAAAFAIYHDVSLPGGGVQWNALLFYLAAGLYFGTIYLARGFGIVVACHAIYDVIALVLLPSQQ